MLSRQQIRQQVRASRRALSAQQQANSAHRVAERLTSGAEWASQQRIAAYLSFDGELDTQALIESCWQQHKHVYLPVLHPFCSGYLLFQRYQRDTELVKNRLGIWEPKLNCPQICPANQLNLLLTPLVAFDSKGNRLGMGGGFYDRTLATLSPSVQVAGIAHDLQCYPALPTESWDQPLKRIITPAKDWYW